MALSCLTTKRDTGVFQFKVVQAFVGILILSLIILVSNKLFQTPIYAAENGFKEVYHVYVDGEYIGKVDDRSIIEKVIEDKLNIETEQEVELVIDQEITYVIEKGFNPRADNDQVIQRLDNLLMVSVEAFELKIGDIVVGYFSDEEHINEMINKYKLMYVDEKDIKNIELSRRSVFNEVIYVENINDHLHGQTELSVGESKFVDVTLAKEVEIAEKSVDLDEILTVKQGITLLKKGTLEEEKHKVSKGEVLETIASEYDLTVDELLELNPSITDETLLQIDQELNVTVQKPLVDVIVVEEEMKEEKISYETEIVESDKMYKGEEKVTEKGKNGKKQVHYQVEKTNGKVTNREVISEKVLKKPKKKVIVKGTKVIPSRGSGVLTWPTNGGYISSNYGYRWGRLHKGIDIARPSNRTIKAADHGTVAFAGYKGGYGNKIIINHNNGTRTLYAHLSSINVRVGQLVEKGTQIGIMGSTGNSTGVHLHFEVHQNGRPINPLQFY